MNKKAKLILEALGAGLFGALVMFLFEPAGVTSVITNFLVLSRRICGACSQGVKACSRRENRRGIKELL